MSTAEISAQAILSPKERRRISTRLAVNLGGAGLLAVGIALGQLRPDQLQVAELVKAAAALMVGLGLLRRGLRGFFRAAPESYTDQLVSLAILAAMATGDFVTATLVPLFMEVGRIFEERSALGAQSAIQGIRALQARRATLADGERSVEPSALSPGDEVIVRPGEIIPVDGEVAIGRSSVDQSAVTGESHYELVTPGSPVFAGTLNLNGLLRVRVTKAGGETVLGQVVALLKDVEASKVPAIRLLERYSTAYLPVVLTLAATVLFFTQALDRAIAVLIVACPSALVLAGPAAMIAAMAAGTRANILIKQAGFLDAVADVDTLLLDKTGTVTAGERSVHALRPVGELSEAALLTAAARCGYGSLHPVSRAALAEAGRRGLAVVPPLESEEIPGDGVIAVTPEGRLLFGRGDWIASETGAVVPESDWLGPGAWVASDARLLGFVGLADRPQEGAAEAIQEMRALGFQRIVLLTGDRAEVAQEVAASLDFDAVIADVLPQQKLEVVRAEQAAGRSVMMVGDGVNDALALSGAEVGVAIGARINEVALGGADVALMTHQLRVLPHLVRLADMTRRVMNQNALLGIGFSVVMLTLAARGLISPLTGALFHNLGAILVVINSARLLRLGELKADAS